MGSEIITYDRHCGQCGYNLRGLPVDGVCPECGYPIPRSLTFAEVPPRQGMLVTFVSLFLLLEYLGLLLGALTLFDAWWREQPVGVELLWQVVVVLIMAGFAGLWLFPLYHAALCGKRVWPTVGLLAAGPTVALLVLGPTPYGATGAVGTLVVAIVGCGWSSRLNLPRHRAGARGGRDGPAGGQGAGGA